MAFKDHDVILACFDEESRYILETIVKPAVGVVFSPSKPEKLKRALRGVNRFVALNIELFQMVEEIQELCCD